MFSILNNGQGNFNGNSHYLIYCALDHWMGQGGGDLGCKNVVKICFVLVPKLGSIHKLRKTILLRFS